MKKGQGKKYRISKVALCPLCSSKDIVPYAGFSCGVVWQCKKCKYVGPLYIEKFSKKFLKKPARKTK